MTVTKQRIGNTLVYRKNMFEELLQSFHIVNSIICRIIKEKTAPHLLSEEGQKTVTFFSLKNAGSQFQRSIKISLFKSKNNVNITVSYCFLRLGV